MSSFAMPFNLQQWIEDHRDVLRPPVCNKQIFQRDDYIVMVIGGPNHRTDYHYNETPELFYQLEGDMVLKVIVDGEFRDIPIAGGEIFMLPGKVLHSPQRAPDSIGMVVEQKRQPGQQDGLHWYCPRCHHPLYHEAFTLKNIERDMPVIFDRFYSNPGLCTCSECGTVTTPSSATASSATASSATASSATASSATASSATASSATASSATASSATALSSKAPAVTEAC